MNREDKLEDDYKDIENQKHILYTTGFHQSNVSCIDCELYKLTDHTLHSMLKKSDIDRLRTVQMVSLDLL